MHLDVILQGKLSDFLETEYKKGADAVTKGITNATDGLKNAMRSQVKSSGLSNRLANTWRGNVYPKGKKHFCRWYRIFQSAENYGRI